MAVYSTIKQIKENKPVVTTMSSLFDDASDVNPKIVLRDEQNDAVDMAFEYFCKKGGKKFLWNAKMRFGKTFCALELARQMSAPKGLTERQRANFKPVRRTLIVTHRPVLKDSWRNDFHKIFGEHPQDYQYGSRFEEQSEGDFYALERDAANGEKSYIFFVSMQYIRLSNLVGGDSDDPLKKDILNADWDLIVVDEAHEGTRTERGKAVIAHLTKPHSKVLHLTGTAYNLYDVFSEKEIYTWDYVMEQQAKAKWTAEHPDEPEQNNPYFKLPAMEVRTYNLGKISRAGIKDNQMFSFKEFFRTHQGMNASGPRGSFVHEDEIKKFLDLMCEESNESHYPFSTEDYRDKFRHTLWVVPGVREAKALEKLLNEHDIFGQFDIINVAGKSDDDIVSASALQGVLKKMGYNDDHRKDMSYLKYTITITCSRLITGVTVPPWTAVFYMKGGDSTNVGTYMQTIFRVQSGWEYYEDGVRKIKDKCYVFDFAPDRALKMMAENAVNTTKYKTNKKYKTAETTREKDRENLNEQLELLPVISMDGGKMEETKIGTLFERLDRLVIDRIALNGFNDDALYEMSEIDDLTEDEIDELNEMGDKVAKTSNMEKPKKATKKILSKSGLTPAQKAAAARAKQKEREGKELTEEEKAAKEALRKEREERRKERENRISILRSISLRIPLLMYGAKVDNEDEDLTLNNFTRKIDKASWYEFMPKGVEPATFNRFKKLYNMERFNAAGRKYREWAREADELPIEERIQRIKEIFDCFHNPDKETVLTPWRVVNMHMSDTLGGWCFYNDQFTGPNQVMVEDAEDKLFDMVDTCMPREVNKGSVTAEVFHTDDDDKQASRILEINSKTGKYPLYVAYSFYRQRAKDYQAAGLIEDAENIVLEDQQVIWDDVLKNNVYVLCNTPMAEYITRRTLCGFRTVKGTHIKAPKSNEPTIVDRILTDREALLADIRREGFWNGTTSKKEMKFNAIVSNPPYQEMLDSGRSLAKQLFPKFIELGITLNPNYLTLITPARWFTADAQDNSFPRLREIARNNNHFYLISSHNGKALFPNTELTTVCYFLWDSTYSGDVRFEESLGGTNHAMIRPLFEDGLDIILPLNKFRSIIHKVIGSQPFSSLMDITTGRDAFGIVGKNFDKVSKTEPFDGAIKVQCAYEEIRYTTEDAVSKNVDILKSYKVFTSKGNGGAGLLTDGKQVAILGKAHIATPNMACTDSMIPFGCFKTREEAANLQLYMSSKFLRFMVGILKVSQNLYQNVYRFVPLQDFTPSSDIDWSKSVAEIDQQLYDKYGLTQDERNFIESMIKPME